MNQISKKGKTVIDLPMVIPTRKANPRTKPRPKLITPKKDGPVRPHAIKRAIPETPGPPPGLPPKRMRHVQAKASDIPCISNVVT